MAVRPDPKASPIRSGPRRQVAALPYRRNPGFEVMLVSSRETKRWVIPKGWPMKGIRPHAAAAREALEEAGLEGKVRKKPIGFYIYDKRLANGVSIPVRVEVYPLSVARQRNKWPEKGERVTRWFTAREAAQAVEESDLGDLILAFAADRAPEPDDLDG